jgi:hypothetical protein
MNGELLPLFSKTRFDFGFLTGVNTQVAVIEPAIDLIQFSSLIFLVRVHRITLSAGSLTFSMLNTLPSDEDPQEFTDSATPILSLAISGSAGTLLSATGSRPQAYGKLILTAVQSSTGNPLYAEVSGCLLGRHSN